MSTVVYSTKKPCPKCGTKMNFIGVRKPETVNGKYFCYVCLFREIDKKEVLKGHISNEGWKVQKDPKKGGM